jgi:hypothetical protein
MHNKLARDRHSADSRLGGFSHMRGHSHSQPTLKRKSKVSLLHTKKEISIMIEKGKQEMQAIQ